MHEGRRSSRSSPGRGPAARVRARLNSNLAFYLISAQSCVEKIKPEISVGTKRNKHAANTAPMFPEMSEVHSQIKVEAGVLGSLELSTNADECNRGTAFVLQR